MNVTETLIAGLIGIQIKEGQWLIFKYTVAKEIPRLAPVLVGNLLILAKREPWQIIQNVAAFPGLTSIIQCILARERTLAMLNNQCPKAGGRQLNHHTWNSCFPGDKFLCWGGRKEQSRFEAFLVHTWARLKSSQGGLLQQRNGWFPL